MIIDPDIMVRQLQFNLHRMHATSAQAGHANTVELLPGFGQQHGVAAQHLSERSIIRSAYPRSRECAPSTAQLLRHRALFLRSPPPLRKSISSESPAVEGQTPNGHLARSISISQTIVCTWPVARLLVKSLSVCLSMAPYQGVKSCTRGRDL